MLPWEYFACKWKVIKGKKRREEKRKEKMREQENVHKPNYVVYLKIKINKNNILKMLPWEYFGCKWKVNEEKKKRKEKKRKERLGDQL